MSKSIEFCKQRAEISNFTFLPGTKFKETNTYELFKSMLVGSEQDPSEMFKDGFKIRNNVKVIYDPEADFDYFTNCRCVDDGTLIFAMEIQQEVLMKVITLQTCCVSKIPEDFAEHFYDYNVTYTIGNIVSTCEHSKKFGTKEKPWMTQRDTAMLPIKFDVVPRITKVEGDVFSKWVNQYQHITRD